MDSAQGGNEFVTHLPAECTRLHEAQVMGIGRFSPAHETCLLGDEPQMLFVAIATRLGNCEHALVDNSRRIISLGMQAQLARGASLGFLGQFSHRGRLVRLGLGQFRQPSCKRLLNQLGIRCCEAVLGDDPIARPACRVLGRLQTGRSRQEVARAARLIGRAEGDWESTPLVILRRPLFSWAQRREQPQPVHSHSSSSDRRGSVSSHPNARPGDPVHRGRLRRQYPPA